MRSLWQSDCTISILSVIDSQVSDYPLQWASVDVLLQRGSTRMQGRYHRYLLLPLPPEVPSPECSASRGPSRKTQSRGTCKSDKRHGHSDPGPCRRYDTSSSTMATAWFPPDCARRRFEVKSFSLRCDIASCVKSWCRHWSLTDRPEINHTGLCYSVIHAKKTSIQWQSIW